MTRTAHHQPRHRGLVDPDTLHCPGCREPIRCEPPRDWPATAGPAPLFAHRDRTPLCPDTRGRISEPIELPT